MDARGPRLAVGGKLDLLRLDDAAGVLDQELDLRAAQAALGHPHLRGQGRALEDRRGQVHAHELDVLLEALAARGPR